ncbi:MAG: hypothetical protein WHZ52_00295 [Armatimonadota bacterium]
MVDRLRSRWLALGAAAIVAVAAGIGAVRLMAQQQTPPAGQPDGGAAPVAQPAAATDNPADPARKISFAEAPRGPVTVVRKRAGEHVVTYLRFTTTAGRPYIVEMPAEMAKDPRSRDDWITLFSAYGRDPIADADTRALQGLPLVDNYSVWMAARVAHQSLKVTTTRDRLSRLVQRMNQWSAVHQEARDNGDRIKARAAWRVIEGAKYDTKNALRELAREKLTLGKLFTEAGQFQQARTQYEQTIALNVWPYSAEAVAKLRAIEGATVATAAITNASIVGTQRMGMSDLYQAAVRATGTTP